METEGNSYLPPMASSCLSSPSFRKIALSLFCVPPRQLLGARTLPLPQSGLAARGDGHADQILSPWNLTSE